MRKYQSVAFLSTFERLQEYEDSPVHNRKVYSLQLQSKRIVMKNVATLSSGIDDKVKWIDFC
jgi:hypothetical protein